MNTLRVHCPFDSKDLCEHAFEKRKAVDKAILIGRFVLQLGVTYLGAGKFGDTGKTISRDLQLKLQLLHD